MRIIFAFDGDKAGKDASKRAVRVAFDSLLVPQMIERILRDKGWEIPNAGPFLDDWLLSNAPEHCNHLLFSLGGKWRKIALGASAVALAETMNDYVLLYNETVDDNDPEWWRDNLWNQAEIINAHLERREREVGYLGKETERGSRFQKIKENNELVATVSKDVQLKKAGKEFKGRCPFHDDNTPSLSVSEAKQLWHCFSCGKGGDVITWLQLVGEL